MLVPSLAWGQAVDETTLKIKLLEKLFARLEYRHGQSMGRVKTAFDKKNLTFSRGQQDTVGVELYYQF